jgi:two-component system nitrate/nitrite response regulator NarL
MQTLASSFSVVIIEPQPLYRAAVELGCCDSPKLQVVGSFASGHDGLAGVLSSQPDLALLELDLPDMRGLSVLRALASDAPDTRVVVLSSEHDGAIIYEALALGAAGYVSKSVADSPTVVAALCGAAAGETVISPEIHRFIAAEIRLRGTVTPVQITRRERDVLALVAKGCSAREIGLRLLVSESTVKTHLGNVYEKLGVSDRAAAVAQAMKRGLVNAA